MTADGWTIDDDGLCPECGEPVHRDPGGLGRIPTYCSRRCQVRNLNRRRAGDYRGTSTIRLVVDPEARGLLDRAARRKTVSTQRYVELLLASHVDQLCADEATR